MELVVSQKEESILITMYISVNLLRTLRNHLWMIDGTADQQTAQEQFSRIYFSNPAIADQKSANWLAEPITAAQRTANLKKMLNAVIDMEWEDIKRAYFQTQQEKYPVGSIWDNGVSVTLAGMEVCYHYLSAGNAPFIVNQMKPFLRSISKRIDLEHTESGQAPLIAERTIRKASCPAMDIRVMAWNLFATPRQLTSSNLSSDVIEARLLRIFLKANAKDECVAAWMTCAASLIMPLSIHGDE